MDTLMTNAAGVCMGMIMEMRMSMWQCGVDLKDPEAARQG
jgi:hypothetical protein